MPRSFLRNSDHLNSDDLSEVIEPALQLLDEAWYLSDIDPAPSYGGSDHQGRLLGIMHGLPTVKEGALVLVGCGPETMTEMTALMLAVLLRQSNYHVEYLGPDLPTDDLIDYSRISRPKLICLAVESEPTAYLLKDFSHRLNSMRGKPKFAFFGSFMDKNEADREKLDGIYLGDKLDVHIERIRRFLTMGAV